MYLRKVETVKIIIIIIQKNSNDCLLIGSTGADSILDPKLISPNENSVSILNNNSEYFQKVLKYLNMISWNPATKKTLLLISLGMKRERGGG